MPTPAHRPHPGSCEDHIADLLKGAALDLAYHANADAMILFAMQGQNVISSIAGNVAAFDRHAVARELRDLALQIESGQCTLTPAEGG